MTVMQPLEKQVGLFLLACATSLNLLNTQRISGKNWTEPFGKHREDDNRNLERTPSTTRVLHPKLLVSTLSVEVVQDEEVAESSTQSIRIEDIFLAVTPFPDAPEVYEIYDISSPHMDETEEDI